MAGGYCSMSVKMNVRSLLLKCIVFALFERTNSKTMCQPPAVNYGEPANVTCVFENDVSKTKEEITVQRYNDGKPQIVMACRQRYNSDYDCWVKPGYSFDGSISQTMVLGIPTVTEEFFGRYACQVIGLLSALDTCILRRKVTPATTSSEQSSTNGFEGEHENHSPSATTSSELSSTNGFEGEHENHSPSGDINHISKVIVLAFVLLLVLLLCTFAITRTCRSSLQNRPTARTADNNCERGNQYTGEDVYVNHEETSTLNKPLIEEERKDSKQHDELLQACSENDVETLGGLVSNGASVNLTITSNGDTPLHVASRCCRKDILTLLLRKGANINAMNNDKYKALHEACKHGNEAAVTLLLEKGANVNARGKGNTTPLHVACRYECENIVKILLREQAEVNVKDDKGMTPLHVACKTSSPGIVKILLDSGANVDVKADNGLTPFHVACQNGQNNTQDILLEKQCDIEAKDNSGATALRWASENDKEALANRLLTKGADVNTADNKETTPLHVASGKGQEALMNILFSADKINIEARDKEGKTALQWACKGGTIWAVEKLLKKGAEANTRDFEGFTPLHVASKTGSKKVVLALKKYNASIGATTYEDRLTAHDIAKRHNHKRLQEVLETWQASEL